MGPMKGKRRPVKAMVVDIRQKGLDLELGDTRDQGMGVGQGVGQKGALETGPVPGVSGEVSERDPLMTRTQFHQLARCIFRESKLISAILENSDGDGIENLRRYLLD